jgi:hypothetical protein
VNRVALRSRRASRPRLVVVPLDDRPIGTQALVQLAAVAGAGLALPPRPLLGRFRRPGRPEAVLEWLDATLPGADGAVVSLDMVAYGGLVESRSPRTPPAIALERLSRLGAILARHGVRACASSVILRLSGTVTGAATLGTWRSLFELMSLPAGARAGTPDRALAAAAADHMRCRERNHAVNRRALSLVAGGGIDHLALLIEDCSPEGPHRAEEAALVVERHRAGLDSRVSVSPGTDEGSMILMARLLHRAAGVSPAVALDFSPPALADHVPLYEDRPLGRTVAVQAAVCGFAIRPDAAVRLSVVACAPESRDLFVAPPAPARSAPTPAAERHVWPDVGEQVARLLGQGTGADPRGATNARFSRVCGLADVGCANGADPDLAAGLLGAGLARTIAAYAAWNTSANSTGSALAHLAAIALPGTGSGRREAQVRYLLTRWIDDYVYQSVVRPDLVARARADGVDPYAFGRAAPRMLSRLAHELPARARALLSRLVRSPLPAPGGPACLARMPRIRARFPWDRAFEVAIALPDLEVRDAG